jgi:Holliday junction resolvase RusA-like endonuclease
MNNMSVEDIIKKARHAVYKAKWSAFIAQSTSDCVMKYTIAVNCYDEAMYKKGFGTKLEIFLSGMTNKDLSFLELIEKARRYVDDATQHCRDPNGDAYDYVAYYRMAVELYEQAISKMSTETKGQTMNKIFETTMRGRFVSINKKFKVHWSAHRLILTDEYRAFKNNVNLHCREAKGRNFTASAHKRIRVDLTLATYKDIDNMEKCVIDGMQSVVYKNDSQIVEKRTVKHPRRRGEDETIHIEVYEI